MVELIGEAFLPTRFGNFRVMAFRCGKEEHLVLVNGPLKGRVNVRVHSKCLTGDTLESLRCDCRDQMEAALIYISKHSGVFIYLDQEGRGIGLANKIRAYALQDIGYDTVEANEKLGFRKDERDFKVAADILKYLGIKRIRLITNNPEKLKGLEGNGIRVERVSLIVRPNKFNKRYMETKKEKMHHLLSTTKG